MKWISNKTLFNIHGWLGLNLGLLLFVICFSGTFATLSSEVDWLLNEDMRVDKKDTAVQWEKMHRSIKEEYPKGQNLGIYKHTYSGNEDYFASVAYVSLPNGQNRKVYLNPYSGQIQGESSFFNVQRFFRSYHRRFFDGNRGIIIVTLSSFFLLFSALTGFLFYKGWLKNLFKLRIGRSVKAFFSDFHKLIGIWSLIFTLLITLTGVFYFAELMVQAADKYDVFLPDQPAKIGKAELSKYGNNPELLSLDEYVANAQKAYPELDISGLRVPHTPDGYVYIDGQAGNPITRNRANKVYLHPFTGEVVAIQKSGDLNTAEFIADIADPLHFGYFGGLSTKIIWFIFGLALSFAILSGTYLWYIRGIEKMKRKWNRISKSKEQPKKDKTLVSMAGFITKYFTLSRGAVISTALIFLYLISTSIGTVKDGFRSYGPLPEERIAEIEDLQLGPWQATLECEYPCSLEEGTIQARFSDSELPNYASLSIEVVTADQESIILPFEGNASTPSVSGDKFIDISDITALTVKAETYTGESYSASVSLSAIKETQQNLHAQFQSYPDKSYPDVPLGIYLFIGFFGISTTGVLVTWTYFLCRATSKKAALVSAQQ